MQSRAPQELKAAAAEGDSKLAADAELGLLRDILRMLPTGVTVQDEQGRFVLLNDAAAAQLGMDAAEPAASMGLPSRD